MTKHLRVLEEVGVVFSVKAGREGRFALDPRPIVGAQEHLEHVSRQWDTALARFRALVGGPERAYACAMWALIVATIYFGTFLVIGWLAKRVLDDWMARRGVGLDEVQKQAGRRGERTVFLLGIWRKESDG